MKAVYRCSHMHKCAIMCICLSVFEIFFHIYFLVKSSHVPEAYTLFIMLQCMKMQMKLTNQDNPNRVTLQELTNAQVK